MSKLSDQYVYEHTDKTLAINKLMSLIIDSLDSNECINAINDINESIIDDSLTHPIIYSNPEKK